MKTFLEILSAFALFSTISSITSIDKIEVKILDPKVGKCSVKINPGPPRSVDLDAESFVDAKDITVSLVRFSFRFPL